MVHKKKERQAEVRDIRNGELDDVQCGCHEMLKVVVDYLSSVAFAHKGCD